MVKHPSIAALKAALHINYRIIKGQSWGCMSLSTDTVILVQVLSIVTCRNRAHEMAVKVTNAMVSSHLDYCNSLLYHTKRQILVDLKEFKMPYVVSCAN